MLAIAERAVQRVSDRIQRSRIIENSDSEVVTKARRLIAGEITPKDRDCFRYATSVDLRLATLDYMFPWTRGEKTYSLREELKTLLSLPDELIDFGITVNAHKTLQEKGVSCLLPRYKGDFVPSEIKKAA